MAVVVVDPPAGWEQGVRREQRDNRDNDLGGGRSAVVARSPGRVVDRLVYRGDHLSPALADDDAGAADGDLTRSRSTSPVAGILRLQGGHGLPGVKDVAVVGGEDDRTAGAAGLVEDGAQVRDLVDSPVRAAGLSLVQSVIDRVEHHGDHGIRGRDRVADLGSQGPARLGGEVCLVEQRRSCACPRRW